MMNLESEQKDLLYTALAQAQVEFPVIQPNRKAYKNEYADLYALFKPIYPILSKYGLSIRPWGGIINNEQWIGARLMHKSGQYETNVYKFESEPCKNPNDQPTHKKQGSLTYFNRNHMKDMLGLLITDDPEDDDGQSHHTHGIPAKTETLTPDQISTMMHILEGQKDIYEQIMKGFSITSLAQMPRDKFNATIDRIHELKQKRSELNVK